ncbi:Histone deacetylase hda1 [Cystobasidiomycetes sp. EMM_F5]
MDVQAIAGPSRVPYDAIAAHVVSGGLSAVAAISTFAGSSSGETTERSTQSLQARQPANGLAQKQPPPQVNGHVPKLRKGTGGVVDATYDRSTLMDRCTGYCYSSKMLLHQYRLDPDDPLDEEHPEKPERIAKIHETFHTQPPDFFDLNRKLFTRESLFVNEHTALCARLSLGGVIESCRAVAEDRIQNAFAIVRPPGHHSEPEHAMGFCFYNNVAVAAQYLKALYKEKGIRRILILDWDVHHGNGTQRAFWTDPDVLYISLHRYDNGTFYPGGSYGAMNMTGGGLGNGKSVNIPWSCGEVKDADYLHAFQKIVMPIAHEFAPDFVLVSAGYDAAEGDPLGGCEVTPAGYAHMTYMLSALAKGRLVLALEGGYNVDVIATSALACVRVMLGELPPELPPMVASTAATSVCHLVAEVQSQFWDCIKPTFPRREDYQAVATVTPLSEILKDHRNYTLWQRAGLYNVPLVIDSLEAAFHDQLLVTGNLYSAETIVLYLHDSGNIRAELEHDVANIVQEGAFLVDTASHVIDWVISQGWALLDLNLLPHSASSDQGESTRLEKELILHVWDNILE